MITTRFTVLLRVDTDDPEEAIQDATDFIRMSKEGWYSSVQLDGEIQVIESPEEEDAP